MASTEFATPPPESVLPEAAPPPESVDPAPDSYAAEWSTWTKRVVSVALLLIGVYSLNFLMPILTVLILAYLLTFLLFVPIAALTRRTRLSYGASVGVVYGTYMLLLIVFTLALLPQVIQAANQLISNVQTGVRDVATFLVDYTPEQGIVPIVGQDVDLNFIFEPLSQSVQEILEGFNTGAVGGGANMDAGEVSSEALNVLFSGVLTATQVVSGAIGGIGSLFSTTFLVHLAALLFLLEVPRWYATLHATESAARRREYLIIVSRIYKIWIQFFQVQVVTGVIIGTITWLQFIVMGIPSAVFMGVFTALTSLIPNVGGFFALVPMFLIPLFQGSSTLDMEPFAVALLAVAINFGVQMIFWNVFVPKMTSDALELSLPVVILGVFVGASLGGILGAFLVVPFIGSVRVLVIYVLRKLSGGDPYPGEPEPDRWNRVLMRPVPAETGESLATTS